MNDEFMIRLEEVDKYYSACFQNAGASAAGVDWSSERSQRDRFAAIDQARSDRVVTICDFGCGYGAYAAWLNEAGFTGSYTGVDLSSSMITFAQGCGLDHGRYHFRVGNAPIPADLICASGTFNVDPMGDIHSWQAWVVTAIQQMWELVGQSLAFNLLLPPSPPYATREDLYTSPPEEVIALLHTLSPHVKAFKTPGLHEMTYIVRRGG